MDGSAAPHEITDQELVEFCNARVRGSDRIKVALAKIGVPYRSGVTLRQLLNQAQRQQFIEAALALESEPIAEPIAEPEPEIDPNKVSPVEWFEAHDARRAIAEEHVCQLTGNPDTPVEFRATYRFDDMPGKSGALLLRHCRAALDRTR